jgi:Flp pilus assembly protein TadG
MIILVLLVGLGVDLGFAYVTKAQLSKATDAAALMGVRNLFSADVVAISRNTFAMNYVVSGRETGTVVPTVTVVTDPNSGSRRLQVSASATINTFFIRVIPAYSTVTVSAEAEAIRARAVLALVLDKSGSMNGNGGCSALPQAVDTFVSLFVDNLDKMALCLYSSVASTPVTLRQPFKNAISNGIPRNCSSYAGATFMSGGLQLGWTEINREPVVPGENIIRAAVFFTDGNANIIQETVRCESGQTVRPWNFGGYDSPNNSSYAVINATSGSVVDSGNPPDDCDNRGIRDGFPMINGGTQTNVRMSTIRDEAEDRTMYSANQMRAAGIVVYVVGLGSNVNQAWLKDLANDPSSSHYNSDLPSGIAVFSPTAAELKSKFQIVAADIMGRLTR